MIKLRNMDHALIQLVAPGTVTAAADKAASLVPFDGFITNIFAKAGDGGTGVTASIADVHKNGTTIFAAATKVTFAATTGTATYSAQTTDPTPVTAGDVLSLDVDSIATAPKNFVVELLISRTNPGGATNLADQTTVL